MYFGGLCHLASQLAPLPTKLKTALLDGFKILVRAMGLEPTTSTLARLRSSQLSYARIARTFLHSFLFNASIFLMFFIFMYDKLLTDKGLNSMEDYDNDTSILYIAWQNWRTEIQTYWQRALYFFGFISIVGAGYIKIKMDTAGTVSSLPLLLSMLLTMLAFIWYLSNRGSKFWQNNWEKHIMTLESDNYKLMSEVLQRSKNNSKLLGAYPVSPYKANTLVSLIIFLFGCLCVVYEICTMFQIDIYFTKLAIILVIPFIWFVIKIPSMLKFKTQSNKIKKD